MKPSVVPAALAADVPSPCINVCRISPDSGYCEGCLRTVDEIAGWPTYSARQKSTVLRRLPARRTPR